MASRQISIICLVFTLLLVNKVTSQCSGDPTFCSCWQQAAYASNCQDAQNICINCCYQDGGQMSYWYCDNSIFGDLAAIIVGSPNLACQCSYSPVQSAPVVSSNPVATPSVATPTGGEVVAHLGVAILLAILVAVIA